ncbi:MAG TPA: hypothetical protein VF615_07245 [Longimicrobiaceae bacterium]|jgi:hypothetical protein
MPKSPTGRTDRKLVLGRETVRALTRPRTQADATLGEHSSCGEQCGCPDQMQTY